MDPYVCMQTVVGVIITVKKIACLHSFRVSDYNDAIVYLCYLCVFCIISGKRFVSDGF